VQAGQSLNLHAGSLSNAGGSVLAQNVDNSGSGAIQSGGQLTLNATGALNNSGGTVSANALSLQTNTLANNSGQINQTGAGSAQLTVASGNIANGGGQIASNGGLRLNASGLDNGGGTVSSQGDLVLQLPSAVNNQGGKLLSNGAITLNTNTLTNSNGTINGNALQITTGTLANGGGTLQALGSGDSTVTVTGLMQNGGKIASNGRLSLQTQSFDNTSGTVNAMGRLLLNTASLPNAGQMASAQDVEIDLNTDFNNPLGTNIRASHDLILNIHGNISNAGGMLANNTLSLSGNNINNSGTLSGQAVNLTANGGDITNTGAVIGGSGGVTATAATLTNNGAGAVIAASGGGAVTLNASQRLSNQGGAWIYANSGNISLGNGGGVLLNNASTIEAEGSLTVNMASLQNQSSGGNVTVSTVQDGGPVTRTLNTWSWFYPINSYILTGKVAGDPGFVSVSNGQNNYWTYDQNRNCPDGPGQCFPFAKSVTLPLTILSDDPGTHTLTAVSPGGASAQDVTGTRFTLGRDSNGEAHYGPNTWVQLAPADTPFQIYYFGGGGGSYQTLGYQFGQAPYNPNTNLLDSSYAGYAVAGRDTVAQPGEVSRTTTTTVYKDVVSGTAGTPGQILSGGNMTLNVQSATNSFSQIAAGGSLSGIAKESIQNEGKQLHRTTHTDNSSTMSAGYTTQSSSDVVENIDGGAGSSITANQSVSLSARDIHNSDVGSVGGAGGSGASSAGATGPAYGQTLPNAGSTAAANGAATTSAGNLSNANGQVQTNAGNAGTANSQVQTNAGNVNAATGPALDNSGTAGAAKGKVQADTGNVQTATGQQMSTSGTAGAAASQVQANTSNANTPGGQQLATAAATGAVNGTVQANTDNVNAAGGHKLDTATGANPATGQANPPGANAGGLKLDTASAPGAATRQVPASSDAVKAAGGQNLPNAAATGTVNGGTVTANQADPATGKPINNAGGSSPVGATQLASAGKVGNANGNPLGAAKANGAVALDPGQGFTLPGGLFSVHTAPTSHYLVETNPLFTQYDQFISSDYLLQKVKSDPAVTQKRLGDGFYEQQLVARALTDATGWRYLPGYSNAKEQFQALMDNGAQVAQQFNLTPGIALSAAQMAQLTSSMVWLVSERIDGQDVLVPVVYLANSQNDAVTGQGAVIAARGNVKLTADGTLDTSGLIKAGGSVSAAAGALHVAGGVVQATGDLSLSAKTDLTLSTDLANHGRTASVSGNTVTLKAETGNLTLSAAKLDAAGDASLSAGQDLTLGSAQTTKSTRTDTHGNIWSASQTQTQGSQLNVGGKLALDAARDLSVNGSQAKAGGTLDAHAGRDLSLNAGVDTRQERADTHGWFGDSGFAQLHDSVVDSVLQGGGDTTLKAGNQLTIAGGQALSDSGKVMLGAKQGNVELGTVATRSSDSQYNAWSKQRTDDLTQNGATIKAANGLVIDAGQDLNSRAAMLSTTDGQATLTAGRDVNLGTATNSHSDYKWRHSEDDGFFSSTTTNDIAKHDNTSQVGSSLSADTIKIQSGRDLNVTGSTVAGTNDVGLEAGRDLTITADTNTGKTYQLHEETTSGLFGTGGIGFTIGSKHMSDELKLTGSQQSQARSQVGSINGNLTLKAGGKGTVHGSDVVAGKDIIEDGTSMFTDAGVDKQHSVETIKTQTSGLTVQITSPAIAALQTALEMEKALRKTSDGRIKALAAVTAALAVKNGVQATQNAGGVKKSLKLSVTVGGSTSENVSTSDSSTLSESVYQAGGRIVQHASGAGADSSITSIATKYKAGDGVSLIADGAVNLGAGQNSSEQHTKYTSISGGAGIAASGSGGSGTIGFNGYANVAAGRSDGNGTDQVNTTVDAGNKLTIKSGGDTNLNGAILTGKRVEADIDGNLHIGSLQDTSSYHSLSGSASVDVTVGYGSGVTAYVGLNGQKIDADYSSVGKQSGIKAGDDGFRINVKGNTDLKGAVIESSQAAVDAGKNSLSTGTLTTSDIENHSKFSAVSVSASGGTGGFSAMALGAQGDERSTTQSGISGGKLTITDNAGQLAKTGQTAAQAAGKVKRDLSTATDTTHSLGNNFNAQEVETAFAVTGAFVQQVNQYRANQIETAKVKKAEADKAATDAKAVNDFAKALPEGADKATAQQAAAQATADAKAATDAANAKSDGADKTAAQQNAAQATANAKAISDFASGLADGVDKTAVVQSAGEQTKASVTAANTAAENAAATAAKWAPGSTYGQIATAITSGVSGNVTGGLANAIQSTAVAYLQGLGAQEVKKIADGLDSETARAALHAVVGCAGAAASGQSCGAGASGAAASVVLNNLLGGDPSKMTAAEKRQREGIINAIVAGVAATAGGSGAVKTAVNAATIEMENNYLTRKEVDSLLKSLNEKNCDNTCKNHLLADAKTLSNSRSPGGLLDPSLENDVASASQTLANAAANPANGFAVDSSLKGLLGINNNQLNAANSIPVLRPGVDQAAINQQTIANSWDKLQGSNLSQSLPVLVGAAPDVIAVLGAGKMAAGAVIGGSFDALGQYSQTGHVRLGQSVFSAATGAVFTPLGMNTGVLGNIGLGGLNGVINTKFQNSYYGDNNNILWSGAAGGAFGGVGTLGGNKVSNYIGNNFPGYVNPSVPAIFQPKPTLFGVNAVNFGNFVGATVGGTSSLVPSIENKKP